MISFKKLHRKKREFKSDRFIKNHTTRKVFPSIQLTKMIPAKSTETPSSHFVKLTMMDTSKSLLCFV